MKRNEMTPQAKSEDKEEYQFSLKEWPMAEGIEHLREEGDITELRARVLLDLLLLPDNDIIDLILEALPEKVGLTYEAMITKRHQEETNNKFSALNHRPSRPKQEKLRDLLNKMNLQQLQDLEAKLLQADCPSRRYI